MSFREALRSKDFVVTAELPLSPETTRASLLGDADLLSGWVDGFVVTDNQYGQPHLSPTVAAGILLSAGHAPVLQLGCRNRNRIALMGELLAARALGVDSLLLVRGTPLPDSYQPRPKAVVDMEVKELLETARLVNEDEKLAAPAGILVGTSATVHDPEPGWQPAELLAKAKSGAQFIMTQACFDIELLRRYLRYLVEQQLTWHFKVIVSVLVMPSMELAVWLQANRQRIIVPPATIARLEQSQDPGREGGDICVELVQAIREIPGIAGVNFTAGGYLETIPDILSRAGIAR